jgi:hypothetical protein
MKAQIQIQINAKAVQVQMITALARLPLLTNVRPEHHQMMSVLMMAMTLRVINVLVVTPQSTLVRKMVMVMIAVQAVSGPKTTVSLLNLMNVLIQVTIFVRMVPILNRVLVEMINALERLEAMNAEMAQMLRMFVQAQVGGFMTRAQEVEMMSISA